jgi:hypothetical protein
MVIEECPAIRTRMKASQNGAMRVSERLGVLRRRYRERFGARDTGILHPRLQQLEGPRLVPDGVSAVGEGFEKQKRARVADSGAFQKPGLKGP